MTTFSEGTHLSLPPGYREYVGQLGEGIYSENLEVWLPDRVLACLEEERKFHAEYFQPHYLEWQEQPIGQGDVDKCVELAFTPNGNTVQAQLRKP